jgi:hypothetical protein
MHPGRSTSLHLPSHPTPPVGSLSVIAIQGRAIRKGDLVTQITVTSSIFNFSTWFFAQIVENRETQLSSPFLGPGDNFSKSYDENQIWSERQRQPARSAARAGSIPTIPGGFESHPRGARVPHATTTRSGFRHNFSKIFPQDLKMG